MASNNDTTITCATSCADDQASKKSRPLVRHGKAPLQARPLGSSAEYATSTIEGASEDAGKSSTASVPRPRRSPTVPRPAARRAMGIDIIGTSAGALPPRLTPRTAPATASRPSGMPGTEAGTRLNTSLNDSPPMDCSADRWRYERGFKAWRCRAGVGGDRDGIGTELRARADRAMRLSPPRRCLTFAYVTRRFVLTCHRCDSSANLRQQPEASPECSPDYRAHRGRSCHHQSWNYSRALTNTAKLTHISVRLVVRSGDRQARDSVVSRRRSSAKASSTASTTSARRTPHSPTSPGWCRFSQFLRRGTVGPDALGNSLGCDGAGSLELLDGQHH